MPLRKGYIKDYRISEHNAVITTSDGDDITVPIFDDRVFDALARVIRNSSKVKDIFGDIIRNSTRADNGSNTSWTHELIGFNVQKRDRKDSQYSSLYDAKFTTLNGVSSTVLDVWDLKDFIGFLSNDTDSAILLLATVIDSAAKVKEFEDDDSTDEPDDDGVDSESDVESDDTDDDEDATGDDESEDYDEDDDEQEADVEYDDGYIAYNEDRFIDLLKRRAEKFEDANHYSYLSNYNPEKPVKIHVRFKVDGRNEPIEGVLADDEFRFTGHDIHVRVSDDLVVAYGLSAISDIRVKY